MCTLALVRAGAARLLVMASPFQRTMFSREAVPEGKRERGREQKEGGLFIVIWDILCFRFLHDFYE